MGAVIVYVVSGTVAAGAVTPVDKVTHTAGSPIVIGGGAQSIAVTPMTRTGSPITGGRREATVGSDRDLHFPRLVGHGRATAVI